MEFCYERKHCVTGIFPRNLKNGLPWFYHISLLDPVGTQRISHTRDLTQVESSMYTGTLLFLRRTDLTRLAWAKTNELGPSTKVSSQNDSGSSYAWTEMIMVTITHIHTHIHHKFYMYRTTSKAYTEQRLYPKQTVLKYTPTSIASSQWL